MPSQGSSAKMSENVRKSKWERKRVDPGQPYSHVDSDAVLKSPQQYKPRAHARTISGQFPCPCVTFGSPDHQEVSRVWDAHLRRRFQDEPTRDKDEARPYGKETHIMYPSKPCVKEASRRGIPLTMKSQTSPVRRVGVDETRPNGKGNKIMHPSTSCTKKILRHGIPSTMMSQINEMGSVGEDETGPYTSQATTRFDDGHKIMYPSAKKEARHGFSSMKSRTCQVGSRVCRSLAKCFRPYTYGPFNLVGARASRENLATASPDRFRHPIPNGSHMVVPRCFQFHSQVIGGGRLRIPECNFQNDQSLEAIYEPPSHENGDGVSPESSNERKTSSFNVDDVIQQLQREEHDWSDLNQGEFRERRSRFFPEKSPRQAGEFEGSIEGSPQFGRGRLRIPSFRPQSNDGDDHSESPNESRRVYSDSSRFFARQQKLGFDDVPRRTTNAEQFPQTCQDVDALGLGENDLDVPERDSDGQISDGVLPNALEIDEKFVRHLFGTEYDVTTRNYRRFNDEAQHILNYDISDLLLDGARLKSKGTSRPGLARGDESSEEAPELKFQHTLDSLQKKINKWKVITKAS